MGKRKKQIRKEELEKADPQLLPPTQNMEENLARGESSMVPDPDDVPGGATSTQNGQIIPVRIKNKPKQRDTSNQLNNQSKNKCYSLRKHHRE